MDDLLGIGDFSDRCGLTPKMLRTYAAAGLLIPALVDASSGYRYYSEDQLQRAQVIGLLRRAGISVAEIAAFFRDPDPTQLERWGRRIEAELAHRRRALVEAQAVLAIELDHRDELIKAVSKGDTVTYSLATGSATHQGQRDSNQDALLVGDDLFAVADGLGGLEHGEIASTLALETLNDRFAGQRSRAGLISACEQANQVVWNRATSDTDETTMGTTVAALGIIPGQNPVVVHVGDSRLYRYRDQHLERLTDDHSIIADLILDGKLTEQDALTHPQRHILTRALGVGPTAQVDASEVAWRPGDRMLLCTDGLFKALNGEQLEAVLSSQPEPQRLAEELVLAAVDNGAEDNVTVVVIDVR